MTLIVDRIESAWAVLELPGGGWWRAPIALLPQETEEGDALKLCGDALQRDPDTTRALRASASALLQRLSQPST